MDKTLVKIVKKKLTGSDYSSDIFILKYLKPTWLGLRKKWVDFPICFQNEYTLKDFIKNSYIFNHNFQKIESSDHVSLKYIKTSQFVIRINNLVRCLGYTIFADYSYFSIVEEVSNEIKRYPGDLLSDAYKKYLEGTRLGSSDILEEKMYMLVQENIQGAVQQ